LFLTCLTPNAETKDGNLKVGKKLFKGAVGAVRQAKKTLAAPVRRRKQKKQPIDELKVVLLAGLASNSA